jgi:drug/metabolite transporter (DMT)-like permease
MGVVWAAASGIGFGLFQSVNARAVREIEDPYLSTFVQLLTAALVLALACVVGGVIARLDDASALALASFALAGALHFCVGWTLINLSHTRVGAARTSPLLSTTPLFGVVIAAVALGELPSAVALGGIVLMALGAYVIADSGAEIRWRDALLPLGTAATWALSPVLAVRGLEELDSPLLGAAIGLALSSAVYAVLVVLRPRRRRNAMQRRRGVALKLLAGLLAGFATWGRWVALGLTPVGVVLALAQLAAPVVLIAAPLIVGRHIERVTARVWLSAGSIVGGSLILIAAG